MSVQAYSSSQKEQLRILNAKTIEEYIEAIYGLPYTMQLAKLVVEFARFGVYGEPAYHKVFQLYAHRGLYNRPQPGDVAVSLDLLHAIGPFTIKVGSTFVFLFDGWHVDSPNFGHAALIAAAGFGFLKTQIKEVG